MNIGWLLDTCILSAFSPGKPPVPPVAVEWLRQEADRCYIPTLALQEIRKGIAKLERMGSVRRSAMLMTWLNGLMSYYRDRIIPLDESAALAAGLLEDAAIAKGRDPGLGDILIAGTAQSRGLTILTVNVRHFEPLGVPFINPFTDIPTRKR